MIALTLGIGDGWAAVARRSAARMAAMTGLRTEVITEPIRHLAHPAWNKCDILEMFPEEESFLYFDADIVCLRAWDPVELWEEFGRAFYAVPEPPSTAVEMECQRFDLDPTRYINAGLLLFGREHAPIFERTLERHPQCGSWYEQTAMNIALQELNTPVEMLAREFNSLCHHGRVMPSYAGVPAVEVINLHLCSVNSPVKLMQFQDLYRL